MSTLMLIDTSALSRYTIKKMDLKSSCGSFRMHIGDGFSVASYLELTMVTRNREWIENLIRVLDIELRPISTTDAEEAIKGFFQYGTGIHPAKLNFGDCIAYGTAEAASVHLLFKGDDFTKTDVVSVTANGEERYGIHVT